MGNPYAKQHKEDNKRGTLISNDQGRSKSAKTKFMLYIFWENIFFSCDKLSQKIPKKHVKNSL